jgi:PhnB protein
VRGAKAAAEFYKRAQEIARQPAQDGERFLHCHLRVNDGDLLMSDDFSEAGAPSPAGVTLHLQVDDADSWWRRALDAGMNVKMELADQFWGDRYGQLRDPFGHIWSIGSTIKK